MRVLLVKTSSLGDVIHTLPALTDARRVFPEITFDWLVEENFAEIPTWHPAVDAVIPVSLRKWRKAPWQAWRSGAWRGFKQALQRHYYDYVIDAQGLLKSAWLARQARGLHCGLDWRSAREPAASCFYRRRFAVARQQHAVSRTRALFAAVLGYPVPKGMPDYGLQAYGMTTVQASRPTLVFLHGTTWPTKHWPEEYWIELARRAVQAGFRVRLPWGGEVERARAERIAGGVSGIGVMPASTLQGLAAELSSALAVVGTDSGLAHLAAALNTPSVTLYGPTDAARTGTFGLHQLHLQAKFPCAPCLRRTCNFSGESRIFPACFSTLPPSEVWHTLMELLETRAWRPLIEVRDAGRGRDSVKWIADSPD